MRSSSAIATRLARNALPSTQAKNSSDSSNDSRIGVRNGPFALRWQPRQAPFDESDDLLLVRDSGKVDPARLPLSNQHDLVGNGRRMDEAGHLPPGESTLPVDVEPLRVHPEPFGGSHQDLKRRQDQHPEQQRPGPCHPAQGQFELRDGPAHVADKQRHGNQPIENAAANDRRQLLPQFPPNFPAIDPSFPRNAVGHGPGWI